MQRNADRPARAITVSMYSIGVFAADYLGEETRTNGDTSGLGRMKAARFDAARR
jgi:hypothetical protein